MSLAKVCVRNALHKRKSRGIFFCSIILTIMGVSRRNVKKVKSTSCDEPEGIFEIMT